MTKQQRIKLDRESLNWFANQAYCRINLLNAGLGNWQGRLNKYERAFEFAFKFRPDHNITMEKIETAGFPGDCNHYQFAEIPKPLIRGYRNGQPVY